MSELTDKEVLRKVIEKAIEEGMPLGEIDKGTFYATYVHFKSRKGSVIKKDMSDFQTQDCYGLMFSHSFAKAFWGEERMTEFVYTERGTHPKAYRAYEYHLQQMVLEENPINYLRKFI